VSAIEAIDHGLEIIVERLRTFPDFRPLLSAEAQFKYLQSLLNGTSNDRSRLREINLGLLAVREFEANDPELAEALFAAQSVAMDLAFRNSERL